MEHSEKTEYTASNKLVGCTRKPYLLLNKKGEEIVEAAIVLPLILLVILSIILLLIYFYSCLQTQVSVHHELLERQEIFCHVYRVSRHAQATEKQMQGLCRIMMRSECQGRIYLIQPADLILTGEEAKLYLQK